MLYSIFFLPKSLQIAKKLVPLHRVFHSIRFKVNKGWVRALTLFFVLFPKTAEKYRFSQKKIVSLSYQTYLLY